MSTNKRRRESITREVAARVLFQSDRTCCVCRVRGKPVQIHHIDDNPANNDARNLAVLCFDCHRETQLRGGFDRKLDAEQVLLYRDDWQRFVARQRAAEEVKEYKGSSDRIDIEHATSIAEIYKDKKNYVLLAIHYDVIGNRELRDKYIELAFKEPVDDDTAIFLRGLQGRPDLLPQELVEREYKKRTDHRDWLQRARMLTKLGRHREAIDDYLRGIHASLNEDRVFTGAYYLKELAESKLIEELFVLAFKQAREDGDLWWQVRALQELGWDSELDALLRDHEDQIRESGNLNLLGLLAISKDDEASWLEIQKKMARLESTVDEQSEPEE